MKKSGWLSCSIWRFTAISMVAALALVFSLVAVIMPANPAMADPHTVTSLEDSGAGSLRWAIANATADDTIEFTVTGTITLASQLTINKSLTITGPGEDFLAISGNNTSRVFHVDNLGVCIVGMSGMTIRNGNVTGTADGSGLLNEGGNVTMTSCTVSGNTAEDGGGGLTNEGGNVTMTSCTISGNTAGGSGGGLSNEGGNVTMTDCTVSDNTANTGGGGGGGIYNYMGNVTMTSCTISDNTAHEGGGIDNEGDMTMMNCTISGNNANGDGGGIHNSGNVTLTDCTVSGNTAYDSGGGIFNGDEMTMVRCTVSGNTAEDVMSGGGIFNNGELTMTNCTVSGNTSDEGGGIYNSDVLTIINCTISDNTAEREKNGGEGGGIYNSLEVGNVTMTCTIVYGNTAVGDGDDIFNDGIVDDPTGESIVGDADGYSDGDPDPLLDPLGDNGGPTETHALMAGSPAIDACTTDCPPPATDQRGIPRPQLNACDVGAYEYQQQAVGGIVEPVDKLSLLAPWLGLAVMMAVAIVAVVVMRKRIA